MINLASRTKHGTTCNRIKLLLKKKAEIDQRPQSEDFIETARKLGSDESREGFERVFEKIVRPAPAKAPRKDDS